MYPAPGSVGATGPLQDVYPAGGVLVIKSPTTLSNVKIHGGIDIYANTTLKNVYVENDGSQWWGNVIVRKGASLLAEDCTIKPTNNYPNPARAQDGILDVDSTSATITIRRCDISRTGKGVMLGSNMVIEDSWFHSMTPYQDPTTGVYAHKGSVMLMGGSHIRISGCRFTTNDNPNIWDPSTNPFGFQENTQTSAILLQPWGPISDVTVENSFLEGGYAALRLQAVNPSNQTVPGVTGIVIRNNVFGPYPVKAPYTGMYYTYDPRVQLTTWSGNVTGDVNGVPTQTAVAHP